MLQAKTKEQRRVIFDILKNAGNDIGSHVDGKEWEDYFYDNGVCIESDDPYCFACVNYDTMAKIVDYLRASNDAEYWENWKEQQKRDLSA